MQCSNCSQEFVVLPPACARCGAEVVLAGRYAIRGLLGRGGMGEVYLAHDGKLAMDVAMKRVPAVYASDPALRAALTREARILARLTDDCIVRMFDLLETEDGLFLILEYVCGPSLHDMLNNGYAPSISDTLSIFASMAKGLETAHGNDVIHRDLKPGNLLVQLYGEERQAFLLDRTLPANLQQARVKITDFGLAKPGASTAQASNMASGTPAYMAPEQFRGEGPSRETDVYAMGVIAYRLVSGRLPFDTDNLAYCHLMVEPSAILSCPSAINAVILRAMAKPRERRYPSASAFYTALAEAAKDAPQGHTRVAEAAKRAPQDHTRVAETILLPPKPPKPRSLEWKLALTLVAAFAIAILAVRVFRASKSDTTDAATGVVVQAADATNSGIDLRGLPFIAQPPPVIEETRGAVSLDGVTGPRNARMAWSRYTPFSPPTLVSGIGKDGTAYLTGGDAVGAVRDGRFLWAYKARTGGTGLLVAADGRIWARADEGGYFCLNRDGQGGLLPASIEPPKSENRAKAGCGERRGLVMTTSAGETIETPLDFQCSYGGAKIASDGFVYAGTEEPSLVAVDAAGKVVWKLGSRCAPHSILAGKDGQVLFVCEDNSLHRVDRGKLVWSKPGDGEVQDAYGAMVMDAAGTAYFADRPKDSRGDHVHAISAKGESLWTLSLTGVTLSNLMMDGKGRLYGGGMSGMRQVVLCLADR